MSQFSRFALCALLCAPFSLLAAAPAIPESKPPDRPAAALWLGVDEAETNIPLRAESNSFTGRIGYLLTKEPPGPEGYFATFTLEVEQPGRFDLWLACSRIGAGFTSPIEFFLDGKKVAPSGESAGGGASWGVANSVSWNNFGAVELSRGTHEFKMVVEKQRAMDSYISLTLDAIALRMAGAPDRTHTVEFTAPAAPLTVQAGQILSFQPDLRLTPKSPDAPAEVPARLELSLNSNPIAQVEWTLPSGAAPVLTVPIPFDAPSGDCKLSLSFPGNLETSLVLATVRVEGRFPALPRIEPKIAKPSLDAPAAEARAGSTVNLRLRFPVPPTGLPSHGVVRLSLDEDRPYYVEKVALGPDHRFTVNLPADLPGGEYLVDFAVIGQAYMGTANDLRVGALEIAPAQTPPALPRKVISTGVFVDSTGVPHLWNATPEHTWLWDGDPVLLMSGMYAGPYIAGTQSAEAFADFERQVRILLDHGIHHIYLSTQTTMERLPAYQWQTIMDFLESVGMSYVIGHPGGNASSLGKATGDKGFGTQEARPIRAAETLQLKATAELPGKASRTLKKVDLGFAPDHDTLLACEAIAISPQGKIAGPVACTLAFPDKGVAEVTAEFKSGFAGEAKVVFLPRLRVPQGHMGTPFHETEAQGAAMREYLRRLRFGPGFRGLIDPGMRNERGIYNQNESLFIDTTDFLTLREKWLKTRYSTIEALARAWMMEGLPKSFEQAARLYPAALVNAAGAGREALLLVDPVESTMVRLDARTPYWLEYCESRDELYLAAHDSLCDSIRSVLDVPHIYKRVGQTRVYNSGTQTIDRGMDGVGYEAYGIQDSLISTAAGYGYAELLQAGKTMFGVVTEMSQGATETMPPNYPDLPAFAKDLSMTCYFGGKSTYLFHFDVIRNEVVSKPSDPRTLFVRNNMMMDPRMLEWTGLWEEVLAARAPEIAGHRAVVYTSFPPLDPWWARPSQRMAVHGVGDTPGFLPARTSNEIWVVPVSEIMTPAPITFVSLMDAPATTQWGPRFEELLAKKDRRIVFVGLRRDLGSLSIDKYFSKNIFEDEGETRQALVPTATSTVLKRDAQGRVWSLEDGHLQIVAASPAKGKLANALKHATMPPVERGPRTSTAAYQEDLLGVKTIEAAHGLLKGITFAKGDVPEVALHVTSRQGGETAEVRTRNGAAFDIRKPGAREWETIAAGASAKFTFPAGPGDDPNVGAGLGLVRLRGVIPDALDWTINGARQSVGDGGGSGTAPGGIVKLPAGVELPRVILPETFNLNNIDHDRADAALRLATSEYGDKNYPEASRLAGEWRLLASPAMIPYFALLEGAIALGLEDPVAARAQFQTALEGLPNHPAATYGLALAQFQTRDLTAMNTSLATLATAPTQDPNAILARNARPILTAAAKH